MAMENKCDYVFNRHKRIPGTMHFYKFSYCFSCLINKRLICYKFRKRFKWSGDIWLPQLDGENSPTTKNYFASEVNRAETE